MLMASKSDKKGLPIGSLMWLPHWSQLSGVLPDGQPDPQEYNDCGETCCGMVIACVHGTPIEPGELRQRLGGWERTGLTSGQDLVNLLNSYNVGALTHELPPAAAMAVIKTYWAQALPCIILGEWEPPNALHWVLVNGYGNQYIDVINPWNAQEQTISFGTFVQQYRGTVVAVGQHLHYNMSKEPTPGT